MNRYLLACPACGAGVPSDEVQWDGAEDAPADFGICPKCGTTSEADEWVEAEEGGPAGVKAWRCERGCEHPDVCMAIKGAGGECKGGYTAGVPAAPAPLADEAFVGWKLVPIQPTMAMLDAADSTFQRARISLVGFNARELAYQALLDAAPPHGVDAPGEGQQ